MGIRVGKPDVRLDAPSHVPGIEQGNAVGNDAKQRGHHPDGTADARRSTGVAPRRHDPVLPTMPNIPPP